MRQCFDDIVLLFQSMPFAYISLLFLYALYLMFSHNDFDLSCLLHIGTIILSLFFVGCAIILAERYSDYKVDKLYE